MKDIIDELLEARGIVSLTYNKSHFIKFSEFISRKYSLESSVLLGIMIDLENLYLEHYTKFLRKTKGYFPVKSDYIDKRVGMSYHRQRQAISALEKDDIILIKKWTGNINLYQLNHSKLGQLLIEGAIFEMKNRGMDGKTHEDFNSKISELESIESDIKKYKT